ncbi:hypothetical protein [Nonomuraea dietziae]|uniref:hypothetical protein n=1 Tax=Nonomuraea dietziae TaxID=65515 RepID=UPI00344AD33F
MRRRTQVREPRTRTPAPYRAIMDDPTPAERDQVAKACGRAPRTPRASAVPMCWPPSSTLARIWWRI